MKPKAASFCSLHVKSVPQPTYIVQNKDDVWTMYDLISVENKKLHWIENGDTRRFIGYNIFGENPETMVEFFDKLG